MIYGLYTYKRFQNYMSMYSNCFVCITNFYKNRKGGGGGNLCRVINPRVCMCRTDDTHINFNAQRAYKLTRVPLLADIS